MINPELTSMKVLEFWFAGSYQSIQHLGCIGWTVYLSPCYILPVHHFLGKYSVNYTLLVPPCVCQALLSFSIEGNSFSVISVVDLCMEGEWTKGYLVQAQLPHQKTKFLLKSVPIGTQYPENQVTDMTNKSNSMNPGALYNK